MQVEDTGQPEKDQSETVCRVCGHDDGSLLWDRHGVPKYVICDSCGIESGLGDDQLSKVRETRGHWLGRGAPWDVPKNRPAGWDVLAQLSAVPPEWR